MPEHLDRAREHRAGLRSAIGRVERALAAPGGGRVPAWSKELADELDALAEVLETHVRVTEEPGGLLDDIVEHAPRLAHRVQKVRDEHVTLQQLCEAARRTVPCDADCVREARDRSVELLTALVRHRHVGSDLVYDAFNVDLEAAD